MNKRSIIEQIKAHGAVAAHTTERYVDIVNRVPVKVLLKTPIYMAKDKIRKGDKIAIIDLREKEAFICTVSAAGNALFSSVQTLSLVKPRKISLD
jgi:hypothetical protein